MNKRFLVNYYFKVIDNRVYLDNIPDEHPSEVLDKNEQLLNYIFSGSGHSDLAMFLGEKTNAEVRQFIELNLMKNQQADVSQMSLPTDLVNNLRSVITDDDIAYFSRNDGEDNEAYAQRMKDYFETEKYKNALRANQEKLKKVIRASVDNND